MDAVSWNEKSEKNGVAKKITEREKENGRKEESNYEIMNSKSFKKKQMESTSEEKEVEVLFTTLPEEIKDLVKYIFSIERYKCSWWCFGVI